MLSLAANSVSTDGTNSERYSWLPILKGTAGFQFWKVQLVTSLKGIAHVAFGCQFWRYSWLPILKGTADYQFWKVQLVTNSERYSWLPIVVLIAAGDGSAGHLPRIHRLGVQRLPLMWRGGTSALPSLLFQVKNPAHFCLFIKTLFPFKGAQAWDIRRRDFYSNQICMARWLRN